MNSKFLKSILCFSLGAALMALSVPAFAASWGSAKGGTPTMKELIPKMSGGQAYTERYGFAVDLDQGGHIGVDFTISNLGWGSGHGAVQVRVDRPGQKKYRHSEKLGDGDWSYSKDKFSLDISNTQVDQVGNNGFRVRHDGSTKFDITFTNKMPMWKPGSGRVKSGEGYYQFNLIAPRADVKGTVTQGGKTVEVTGKRAGYADHVATDVAPFNFATRFSRLRNYNDDVFVFWREISTTDDFGGGSVTFVMIGYKDKIVFSDANASWKGGQFKVDPKTNYRVPLSIQIDGKSGKDSIKLVMKGRRYTRTNLLDSYGRAAKLVASAFTEPIRYKIKCEYQLEMNIGGARAKIDGKSHFVVDQLN